MFVYMFSFNFYLGYRCYNKLNKKGVSCVVIDVMYVLRIKGFRWNLFLYKELFCNESFCFFLRYI